MRKRLFSILQYVIFLGAGVFLIWWQLKSLTPEQKKAFLDAFHEANYWLILPVVMLTLLSYLSRAIRWTLLMEPLGYKPALKNVFAVTIVGYFANAAFPRLGEVLKCTFLARYEHMKVDKLVGTIIVERTFDIICYIIFIAITVLIQIDVVGDYTKRTLEEIAVSPGFPLWAKIAIVVGLMGGMFLLIRFLFKKYPGNKIVRAINSFLLGILEGFKSIRNLKHRKAFIFHTILIWGLYLMEIYIAFYAMNGTSHLTIKAACSVLTLATLAMIATPNGIGSFPFLIQKTLLIYGISSALGIAFGWLMWGISTGIVIVAGLITLLLLPYMNKNKRNEVSAINPNENI